jgi:hypothetical protein
MRYVSLLFFFWSFALFASPEALYLILPEDPAHQISVHWLEVLKEKSFSAVAYRKKGEDNWTEKVFASSHFLGNSSYAIKKCLLNNLKENQEYELRLVGDESIFFFKTLPEVLDRPLKVVIGGDVYEGLAKFQKMTQKVASLDPDWVILGGDIAYTSGVKPGRWATFLKEWFTLMRGEKGRLIPMAALPGNHDVSSKDRASKGKNSLFFKVFSGSEGLSYRRLDVTNYLSFFLLDTGHIFPIGGEQTAWLEKALQERSSAAWKIPVYHIAAYPSVYSFGAPVPTLIRQLWVPLFERYGVRCAFEHHNHSFKRTHPIKAGNIDPSGITYIGDGCWGVSPRKPIQQMFYLLKKEKANVISLLTISNQTLTVEVFDASSRLIDEWSVQSL